MATILVNDAVAVLSVALTAGATMLTVVDGSEFPAGGKFHIRIDDEIMWVTAVSGFTWTVTRAAEPCLGAQVAVAHAAGATINSVLTVDAMTTASAGSFINPQITTDAYGRITAIQTGTNHFFAQLGPPAPTDGNVGDYSVDLNTSVVYKKF